jgi:hypothetical protein
MVDGEISAELRSPEITEENVLRAAFGVAMGTAVAAGAQRALQPEGM